MNLAESLESTADGAFAVNRNLKIVHWNKAAQDILGFEKSETIGHPCHQILQGLDESHRLICTTFCRIAKSVSRREPITNYNILALAKNGERQWLNMSTITYRAEIKDGSPFILHLFRDNTSKKDVDAFLNKVLEVARKNNNRSSESFPARKLIPPFDELTPREQEILVLLAKGYGTREIAQSLVISPNTVRNHIQHILQKLHVHRRAEAVAYAIKHGLVG
ncbi:MAG: PAS domain-containing protein [Chloroflexi bacterium]|jgi:PAS domain S-box-containing protein|nr:PAS domain-containing protein [Chloroflexota bacterium]